MQVGSPSAIAAWKAVKDLESADQENLSLRLRIGREFLLARSQDHKTRPQGDLIRLSALEKKTECNPRIRFDGNLVEAADGAAES